VGFNAYRPGRIKTADLVMLGAAIAIIVAMIVWVVS
jgi:hypothetical protein